MIPFFRYAAPINPKGIQAPQAGADWGLVVKMYILIRESVPLGFAVLAAAHSSLAAYLKFRDTCPYRKLHTACRIRTYDPAHLGRCERAVDGTCAWG